MSAPLGPMRAVVKASTRAPQAGPLLGVQSMTVKVRITLDVADEYADPDHEMGVTREAYERIIDMLRWLGDDIDVELAGES